MSHVAAVCRRTCGVTSSPSLAARTTLPKALSTLCTGSSFHSTANRCPRRFQRRRCANSWSGRGDRRLALLCLTPARRAAIEHATVKIDPAMTSRSLKRGAANGTCTGTGIESHQDEPRNVLPGPSICRFSSLDLPISPGRPDEARRLRASEPPFPRWPLRREHDFHYFAAQPFTPVMVDRGAQVLQLTAGCGI